VALAARRLPREHDTLAPDGSFIRLLASGERASMVHCTLAPGQTSSAVAHRSVEELWYVLSGAGEVWRRRGDAEQTTVLEAGVSLNIPTGAHFQFRNTGDAPLRFVIATMPPWPGEHEARAVPGRWRMGP
jgi:mannose-6-phosphate isomerase-like protein (cupin superfamily)